uniref:Uncharacterized protein n=1 Tax=Anguilla anguilla TaxID=7936 RepID=A0A0E9U005_ANGAN
MHVFTYQLHLAKASKRI